MTNSALASQANTSTIQSGQKRRRTTEKKYYAVKKGQVPGIYETWDECLRMVKGHKGALFKAFPSLIEAQAFVNGTTLNDTSKQAGEQKFYAVQNGRVPGVYTDWSLAQAQISGFRNPRHKKFTTRAEAEAFVSVGKKHSAYDTPTTETPDEEIRRLIVKGSAPGLITNGVYMPKDKQGQPYELGRGPLPPGAEDGYDPNIKLTPDGEIVNRTEEDKMKTKTVPKEREPPGMLRIYTDGSSLRNGQAGARAGVGVFFGPQDPKYELTPASSTSSSPRRAHLLHDLHSSKHSAPSSSFRKSSASTSASESTVYSIDWRARGAPPPTKRPRLTWRYRNVSEALKGSKQTNQRAELTAILRALDIAPRHRDVTIYTDSRYSIDCVTNWYKNWERNGWQNSKGKNVENRDLIQDVREKMDEREVLGRGTYFVWVKGHATDAGNIAADKLANQGALMGRGPGNADGNEEASEDEGDEDGLDAGDNEPDRKRKKTSKLRDLNRAAHGDPDDVQESFKVMEEAMDEDDDESD